MAHLSPSPASPKKAKSSSTTRIMIRLSTKASALISKSILLIKGKFCPQIAPELSQT